MVDSLGAAASTAALSGSSTTAGASGSLLNKDDFLRLLVTQLRHQDPLSPLDQNQLLAQTTQFAQLEGLMNLNKVLSDFASQTTSNGVVAAAPLLGKTVTSAGSSFTVGETGAVTLPYTLTGSGAPVLIQISDQQGNVVRTITAHPGQAGAHTYEWDGKNASGQPVAPGSYYYRVAALGGGNSSTPPVASVAIGTLEGLEVRNGTVLYRLGGALVYPGDIIDVQI